MLQSKSMLAVPCLPLPMSLSAGFVDQSIHAGTCQKRHSQRPFRYFVRNDALVGSVP